MSNGKEMGYGQKRELTGNEADSWYFRNTISVTGTVNLILCDSPNGSFTLTAEKGIVLNPDSHLIVWAQSGGTGKINAYGGEEYHPGIGNYAPYNSGNLTINGGNFNVSGGNNAPGLGSCGSNSGDITINGGSVNATGGHKADQEGNAPGIGASDLPVTDTEVFTGTMNNIYFYGGNTTANRTGSCPPIGDSTNSTGSIHLANGMTIQNGVLDEIIAARFPKPILTPWGARRW